MNERIEKLALDAGLLNYVDNETPRRYFIDGHADLEEVEKLVHLVVRDVCKILEGENIMHGGYGYNQYPLHDKIKQHFGVNDKPVDDDIWYWSIK
jgi:hypothetical protein